MLDVVIETVSDSFWPLGGCGSTTGSSLGLQLSGILFRPQQVVAGHCLRPRPYPGSQSRTILLRRRADQSISQAVAVQIGLRLSSPTLDKSDGNTIQVAIVCSHDLVKLLLFLPWNVRDLNDNAEMRQLRD